MTRRSPRELERRLSDLDDRREYPQASIARILGYEWTTVDADRHLHRCEADGRVYWWDPTLGKRLYDPA